MGVFARLLRRSKATEEPVAEEVAIEKPPTAGEEPAETAAADPEKAAQAVQTDPATEPGEAGYAAEQAEAAVAADGVEIPRQQSAEDAADHEAGEGART